MAGSRFLWLEGCSLSRPQLRPRCSPPPWTQVSSARPWPSVSNIGSILKKRVIALSRLGVHPQNRGGMYPQPDVVRNLGLKIITKGFNQSEANHEGVSVEEIPCSERAAHSRSDGSPYEPYGDYNSRQCDHKYLVECFSQLHDIMYATLSHSHLLLVLLSWLNGAEWKIDDEPNLSKLLNPDGTFNTAAVAACDEDLADGLGMSDGHGTFRYYRNLGRERFLKFARRRASV